MMVADVNGTKSRTDDRDHMADWWEVELNGRLTFPMGICTRDTYSPFLGY